MIRSDSKLKSLNDLKFFIILQTERFYHNLNRSKIKSLKIIF